MHAPLQVNRAAQVGPSQFDWWQDWRGECVAIVASGPSTKQANLDLLRDRIHVIAIKENIDLCPWADVVYGCDGAWWKHRRGLPEYSGIKLCQDAAACAQFKLHKIDIPRPKLDAILIEKPAAIGSGGNSGFHALNIAVQFGATGILLVGFDMHGRSGAHWYGRNGWPMANNPDESNFIRWRAAFAAVVPELNLLGIDVVNASTISSLHCFRRQNMEAALAGWGL